MSVSWAAEVDASRSAASAGNAGTSSPVTVSVSVANPGDTTAPSASITSPADGTSYTTAQTVTVAASASDNVGVARVEFVDNGVVAGTDTSAPYSHAWSVTSSANGRST